MAANIDEPCCSESRLAEVLAVPRSTIASWRSPANAIPIPGRGHGNSQHITMRQARHIALMLPLVRRKLAVADASRLANFWTYISGATHEPATIVGDPEPEHLDLADVYPPPERTIFRVFFTGSEIETMPSIARLSSIQGSPFMRDNLRFDCFLAVDLTEIYHRLNCSLGFDPEAAQ